MDQTLGDEMVIFRKATPVYSVPKGQACCLKSPNASKHNSILDTVHRDCC